MTRASIRKFFYIGLMAALAAPALSFASLANEDKRGLRITAIDGVFRLPEEEVDLATAALVLSREWGTDKALFVYRRKIDEMAEEILNRLENKHLIADYRAIEVINEYLFKELGFHSVHDADDPDDLFLHVVLDRKRGYCLSLSMLYLSIAERIGMPVYGVVVPGHFFVRYDDGKQRYNIETTSGGAIVDDKHYQEEFKPPAGDRTVYFKNLTKKQSLGCFFNNLGNCYIQREQLDTAYEYLTAAIQVNPSLGEARTNLGNVLLRLNRPAEAVTQYEWALSMVGPDATTYNNMGNAYQAVGRYEQAKDLYLRAIELKKDFFDAYRNLAGTYQSMGQLGKAISQMEALVILKPQDAQNWLYMGQLYRKAGNPQLAQRAFQKALKQNANLADAVTGIGNLYLDQQDYASALDLFRQAITMQPKNVEAWFGRAVALHYLNRTDEEIQAYQQVLAIDPAQTGALQNMGNAYLKQKKAESAISCYLQAIQREPRSEDLLYNLGVAYAGLKQYDKAVESYKKVLSINPDHGAAHNGLAICYYLTDDKKASRTHALRAQQLGQDVQKELLKN
ncbi:MAG: tetratricopeptide repeat protein [Planctomycetes bacterium]|nr:tetratricopeptide repeat protein [Planctomycetota bacterium]